MRKIRFVELAVLLLTPLTLLGAGCPLIPQIEDKIVELALGGSAAVPFNAVGYVNTYDETQTVDLALIDIDGILRSAGINTTDVKDVKLSGVSYRTTRPDPTANRQIVNGTVTIRRGAGPEVPLVTNFNVDVNSVTSFQTATLNQAGVDVINQIMGELLVALQNGTTATNTAVTYHVNGQSTPGGVATDFEWELKVDLSILGTVQVKMLR